MSSLDRLATTARHLKQLSYYQLLAVRPDCSQEELRKAFQQFALAFHPDQFVEEDEQTRALATKVYQRGVEAYTVLRNEATARAYADSYRQGKLRLSPMQRAEAIRKANAPTAQPQKKSQPPPDAEAFWRKMKTEDGREVARRVEKLLQARRFREAYLQLGLLETMEPSNQAVKRKADWLSRYMKKRGL